jgi:hypothetical protein
MKVSDSWSSPRDGVPCQATAKGKTSAKCDKRAGSYPEQPDFGPRRVSGLSEIHECVAQHAHDAASWAVSTLSGYRRVLLHVA